jgi:hypothetical protein
MLSRDLRIAGPSRFGVLSLWDFMPTQDTSFTAVDSIYNIAASRDSGDPASYDAWTALRLRRAQCSSRTVEVG